MPTSPLLAITTPTDASPVNVPVDLLAMATAVDSKGIPRFTTAGNRDTAYTAAGGPIAGQVCSVAGLLQRYNGTAWVSSLWEAAWGVVGRATRTTPDQTGISAIADVTGLSVPFTAVAGRRYKATLELTALSATAAGLRRFYIDLDGATVRTAFRNFGAASQFETVAFPHDFTASAGSCTVKARASSDANTVTIAHTSGAGLLLVEDIGPA